MSSARRRFVVANWKMNLGLEAARGFLTDLGSRELSVAEVEVALAPSAVHLQTLASASHALGLGLYAQSCHQAADGAHTGEVSAPMLAELGVSGVLVGHSERRQEFGESDEVTALKVTAALEAGLAVILCVGETLSERDVGATEAVLMRQLTAVRDALPTAGDALAERFAVAYEPVWAIGTGRVATLGQVEQAVATIRRGLDGLRAAVGGSVRVLYGGSVKPDNAAELLGSPEVDGALVGGASLDPSSFAAIVEAAAR